MFSFGNWLLSIKKESLREAGIDAKIRSWNEARGTARLPPFPLLWGPAEGHLIWERKEKEDRAHLGSRAGEEPKDKHKKVDQIIETSVAMAGEPRVSRAYVDTTHSPTSK